MSSSYNAICIYKCNRRLEDNELLAEINNSESQIIEIINVNGGAYEAALTY